MSQINVSFDHSKLRLIYTKKIPHFQLRKWGIFCFTIYGGRCPPYRFITERGKYD